MRILNDTHLGVTRQAGTTPATQVALANYVHDKFLELLPTDAEDLVINGDLFDGFTVDPKEVLWAYVVLSSWLGAWPYNSLTLIAGNHDWAPRADKLSSFHMLASLLKHSHEGKVSVIDHSLGLSLVQDDTWAVPHMPNQDLFDMELKKALTVGGSTLLLHANYDNNFAAEADHSLNVSEDQAIELIDAGWTLVFAHEHQARKPRKGVIVVGNQFPTSIADCLGNDQKCYLSVTNGVISHEPCWERSTSFVEVDWRGTEEPLDGYQFIRVTGSAKSDEAEAAISTVNALRKRVGAFVVGNAVRVEGLAEMDSLMSMSLEDVTTYDVLAALLEELTEEEGKAVKKLLNPVEAVGDKTRS